MIEKDLIKMTHIKALY